MRLSRAGFEAIACSNHAMATLRVLGGGGGGGTSGQTFLNLMWKKCAGHKKHAVINKDKLHLTRRGNEGPFFGTDRRMVDWVLQPYCKWNCK